MSIIRPFLLAALGLALGGIWLVAAAANLGHGFQFAGNSPWAPVFGGASVAADVIKAAVFLGLAVAWRKGHYIRAFWCFVIWIPVTAWSIISCFSFAANILADTTAGRTLHAVADKSLLRQIDDQVAQVTRLQEIKIKAPPAQWDRIEAEIGRVELRLDRLRASAKSTTATVGEASPVAALLARHIDADNLQLSRVLVFLLMVELASNLGLLAFAPLFGKDIEAEAAKVLEPETPPPLPPQKRAKRPRPKPNLEQATVLVRTLEEQYGAGNSVARIKVFDLYRRMAAERSWGHPMETKVLGQCLKTLGVGKDRDEDAKIDLYVLPTDRERAETRPQ